MKQLSKNTAAVVLLFFFLTTSLSISQIQPAKDSTTGPKYKVESVVNMDGKKSAGLNDGIVVKVSHLGQMLKESNGKQIILYVDWLPLIDCKAFAVDTNRNELRFYLERTDSAKDEWNSILGQPYSLTKHVTISVGTIGGSPIFCGKNNFELVIIRGWQFWVFIVYFIILIAAIYILFKKTNLLRDAFPPNTSDDIKKTIKTPYSLSRSQILFWTVLVLVSYVFIWLATGDVNTITGSTLILLAISSATALSAHVIDSSASTQNAAAPAQNAIAPSGVPAALPIANNPAPGTQPNATANIEPSTGKFWKDILGAKSDDSIHRLQIVAWTIVLGIIFISEVWAYMEMPQFNAALLTLMGISSGTYIGIKSKE